MTRLNVRTLLSAGVAGSMILAAAASARADDGDRWERGRGRGHDRHHYVPEHRYHVVHERYIEVPQRVVYQRPPVIVMPAPVYQAPVYQAPMYSQPVDPSLNFNFTIPLR